MATVVLPSVTAILRVVGLGPDLSRLDPDVLEAARERGSAVHAAIEAHHYGYDCDLPAEYKPWFDAYLRFVEETRHEPLISEFEVVHPVWGYCGHPDRLGWLGGRRTILDWKSGGAKGVQYQLAAYRMAWNATHPTEPVEQTVAVELRRDGSYRLSEIDAPKYEQVWLAAVVVFNARGGK